MSARDAHSDDMERLLRYLGATDPLDIDFGTADRLLDGSVPRDDAPRAYSQVAQALETLRRMPTEAELADERQAVARIAAVIAADTVRYNGERARAKRRGRAVRRRRRVTALALAAAISGVWLVVGLAAANALPKGAQTVASNVLEALGVSVPNPNETPPPSVVVPADVQSTPATPALDIGNAVEANNGNGHTPQGQVNGTASNGGGNGKAHANQDKVPPGQVNGTAPNKGGNGRGSSASTGEKPNAHGGNPNAGGGNPHAGG
jgi:hypothetical protein